PLWLAAPGGRGPAPGGGGGWDGVGGGGGGGGRPPAECNVQGVRLACGRRAPLAYFKAGLPYPDELVMRIIPDASTQVLALGNGEADFLWGVPGPYLSRVKADARFRTAQTGYNPGGSNCIMTVRSNLDRPLLKHAP